MTSPQSFVVEECKGTTAAGHMPMQENIFTLLCFSWKDRITGMVTGLRQYSHDLPLKGLGDSMLNSMGNDICW